MTKFKFNLHLKSASLSSPSISQKDPDTSHDTRIHRSVKDYIASLKSGRFFSVRRRSQKAVEVATSSPLSFGGSTPRTPFASLFASRPTRSEGGPRRHHRRYTVNLSPFPRHSNMDPMTNESDIGLGIILEPDFPSHTLHLDETTNSRLSTMLSNPDRLSTVNVLSTLNTVERRELHEPLLRVQAGSRTPSLPAHRIISQEVEHNRPLEEPLATKDNTDIRRAAEVLQHAAKRIHADGTFSQAETFRFLAPLVVFIGILAMTVILPKYSAVGDFFGMGLAADVILIFLGGVGSSLILLRASIWVLGVLAQSFCEIDLETIFRKSEIVDADGKRMGEAEMVVGLFG